MGQFVSGFPRLIWEPGSSQIAFQRSLPQKISLMTFSILQEIPEHQCGQESGSPKTDYTGRGKSKPAGRSTSPFKYRNPYDMTLIEQDME
jgi:hypothetical protein